MGCGTKLLKTLLVIVNIIFLLAGAALLGIGLWIRFDKTFDALVADGGSIPDGVQAIGDILRVGAYVLIAIGAFTFVIGFCGCCGALKEIKLLLGIYITFVVLILVGEIVVGVVVYVKRDDLIDQLAKEGSDYLRNEYQGNSTADEVWNSAMRLLQCCGVNGTSDFRNSPFSKGNEYVIPEECCKYTDDLTKPKEPEICKRDRKSNAVTSTALNTEGCSQKLHDLFSENSTILLSVAAGVAAFQLFVALLAVCLCCNMDKDD